jgi:hypothetical protein
VFRIAGMMGLSEEEMWDTSFRVLFSMFDGFMELQNRQYEAPFEASRLNAAVLLQPYSKKPIKPKSIMSFPWDVRDRPKLTKDVINKLKQIFK